MTNAIVKQSTGSLERVVALTKVPKMCTDRVLMYRGNIPRLAKRRLRGELHDDSDDEYYRRGSDHFLVSN